MDVCNYGFPLCYSWKQIFSRLCLICCQSIGIQPFYYYCTLILLFNLVFMLSECSLLFKFLKKLKLKFEIVLRKQLLTNISEAITTGKNWTAAFIFVSIWFWFFKNRFSENISLYYYTTDIRSCFLAVLIDEGRNGDFNSHHVLCYVLMSISSSSLFPEFV